MDGSFGARPTPLFPSSSPCAFSFSFFLVQVGGSASQEITEQRQARGKGEFHQKIMA